MLVILRLERSTIRAIRALAYEAEVSCSRVLRAVVRKFLNSGREVPESNLIEVSMRMPKDLVARLDEIAQKTNRSRAGVVRYILDAVGGTTKDGLQAFLGEDLEGKNGL